MQDHTSHIVTFKDGESQEKLLTQSSGAASVTTQRAPENVVIQITNPKLGATVPVLLSQGTFTVQGTVKLFGGAEFESVEVKFGNSSKSASGGLNWKCTSPAITTNGPLKITASVVGSSVGPKEASVNVNVVVTDDVPPTVTITQPAADKAPATEKNGVFTVALQGTATDAMSGVRKVQFSLNQEDFFDIITRSAPFPATLNWATIVTLPPGVALQHIYVRAIDGTNKEPLSPQSQRTVVADKTPPTLRITVPEQKLVLLPAAANGAATLPRLAGTAEDLLSGVQKVEWALNPTSPSFKLAKPKAPNDWSSWSEENIAIPGPAGAPRTLTVRCTDVAGKFSEESISIAVAAEYPPKDPTVQEYYNSLVEFMGRRILVKSQKRLLQVNDLTTEFCQPFQRLISADATLITQPVHQLRIVIEVLRQYMADTGLLIPKNPQLDPQGFAAQQALKEAEASYRLAAYETLLKRIGTSFAEIRAARLADEPTRQALAQRLGFDLTSAPEPERLQQLLLQPGQFTEVDLEALFGLVDTTRDPLQQRNVNPKLLDWQLQFLKANWAAQDATAGTPVIDPDLIGEADLQPVSAAAFLWQSRSTWVKAQLAAAKKARESLGSNLLAGFDTIVGRILGPIADLLALDTQRTAGADIGPQLAQKQLTLAAFVHLMGLRKLAAAGTILLSEWDDVYSILVQVQKLRSAAQWRAEEQVNKIVLGPDFFRIRDPGQALLLPPVSPAWRMNPKARQIWQDGVKARIDQQQSLRQALAAVVDATEEDTLPLLRDALVTQNAATLSQKLQIEIQTSGYQKTTHIHQAIQTLQDILIDLQMGPLEIGWELEDPNAAADFNEEMQWMGSYDAWQAAMQVFLYPENVLLPTLRPVSNTPPGQVREIVMQTPAFRHLMKKLRETTELTPEDARTFAQEQYLDVLRSDYQKRGISVPFLSTPFHITEQCTQADLEALSTLNKTLIEDATKTATSPGQQFPSPAQRLQNMPAYLREIFYFVPMALALQLQKSGQYLAALDWFRVVYAYDLPLGQRRIYYGLELERATMPDPEQVYQRPVFWLKQALNPHDIVHNSYQDVKTARYDVFTRFVVMSLARCLLEFADAEFTQDSNESLPRARSLYMQVLDLLSLPELNPPEVPGLSPNPVIASLRFHAEVCLAKLHSGRNIAGLQRQLELAAPAGLTPTARTFHPTPYRYSTLIDRAKHLVTVAQQVEAAYLSALEKHDSEAYNLLKANQDLGLAQAGVQLQILRVNEATDGLTLANLQQQRAAFQADTYQEFLDAGMKEWEQKLLKDYQEANQARIFLAQLDATITAAQAVTTATSGGFLGSGASGGLASAAMVAVTAAVRASATIEASNTEARMQVHSLRNSIEQRRQEWTLQLGLTQRDVAITTQQTQLAKDHQDIVNQERDIARLQQANAEATVAFLVRKFTNAELYDWMSGVLRQAYSYFLQQATAVARLAQAQLAFERQDVALAFIQNDYWQPPPDNNGKAADRHGLTGSARLLQDIYQIDQFAFETNKRKLQLTKTISLARQAPLEFQRFRDTGVLTFATPMALFDRDFPGHYLRLIKRVRTSVVALIPPNQGIRATLTTSGVSCVVVGGDAFQTISVRRDLESVALTSPMNATGLFELEMQSELLLPFEFTGVDTMWQLEMPKAANPFDYRTIADVLFTIEYTALSSLDYRQQVIQQLDRAVSADRPYSFRQQFADQWYDLNNPEQTATPMVVSFSTTREDFPANVENLTIQQVALYFVLADGETVEDFRAQLHFTERGSRIPIGGEAVSTPEGLISTRLGNATGWMPMIGLSPFGKWQLALPNTVEVRDLFECEAIEDIVFVITVSGRTPPWPL